MLSIADKYIVIGTLGAGAFATVYDCEHKETGQKVAAKVLAQTIDEESLKRFKTEAQILSKLNHERLVRVLAFGLHDGKPYIAMERLSGKTLAEYLDQKGTLPPAEFLQVFTQILEALECLHENGIVHRDLKPANVMVIEGKQNELSIKVFDLGIAKQLNSAALNVTRDGAVLGTPLYMSPEQCSGDNIDPRSDLYTVGVMMYEAVTGEPLFSGAPMEIMLNKIHKEAPGFTIDTLPFLRDLLARDPAERPQSASVVKQKLKSLELSKVSSFRKIDQLKRKSVERRSLVVAMCVICLAASAGLFWLATTKSTQTENAQLTSANEEKIIQGIIKAPATEKLAAIRAAEKQGVKLSRADLALPFASAAHVEQTKGDLKSALALLDQAIECSNDYSKGSIPADLRGSMIATRAQIALALGQWTQEDSARLSRALTETRDPPIKATLLDLRAITDSRFKSEQNNDSEWLEAIKFRKEKLPPNNARLGWLLSNQATSLPPSQRSKALVTEALAALIAGLKSQENISSQQIIEIVGPFYDSGVVAPQLAKQAAILIEQRSKDVTSEPQLAGSLARLQFRFDPKKAQETVMGTLKRIGSQSTPHIAQLKANFFQLLSQNTPESDSTTKLMYLRQAQNALEKEHLEGLEIVITSWALAAELAKNKQYPEALTYYGKAASAARNRIDSLPDSAQPGAYTVLAKVERDYAQIAFESGDLELARRELRSAIESSKHCDSKEPITTADPDKITEQLKKKN